jgi:membrane-associated PAP2 superfamily phosphatase
MAAGLVLAAWDLLGQDLALAHWFGSAAGFAYRDHWLFSGLLHQSARRLAWTLQLCLLVGTLVTILAIWLLKNRSLTSCPWELSEFGGRAAYVSHWNWGVTDGGEGLCFPAGHASAAFAFFTGYFWLRERAPRGALVWLAVTVLAGTTIGLAQQVRGAHYMSHTLWTGWMSWVIAGSVYLLLEHTPVRRWFGSPARASHRP